MKPGQKLQERNDLTGDKLEFWSKWNAVALGLALGVLYWLIDSAVDALAFRQGNLFSQMIRPTAEELWIRSFALCLLTGLGAFVRISTGRRKKLECELRRYEGELEGLVKERTAELQMAMDQLQSKVVECRTTEEALQGSEERFRKIFEEGPLGMIVVGKDFKLMKANKSFCSMLGYDEEELLGKSPEDVTFSEDKEKSRSLSRELLEGKIQVFRLEKRYLKKNGEVMWANLTASAVHSKEGKIMHALGMIEDITMRKKVEKEINSLASIVRNVPEAVCSIDLSGNIFLWNEGAERMFGYKKDEVIGKPISIIIPEEFAREELKHCMGLLDREGFFTDYESVRRTRDGEIVPVEITAVALKDGKKTVTSYASIMRDITERKQREREMTAIYSISKALRSTRTKVEMLPVILGEVVDMLKAEGAALAVRDQLSGGTVIELAQQGWKDWTGLRLAPGEGLVGHVIATGQPYVSCDAMSDPRLSRPDLIRGFRCVACIPLIAEEQTIGALLVSRGSEINHEEVRLLSAIGEIAANAIYRSALHEQTEQHLKRLYALHDIDTAISSSLDLRLTLNILLPHVRTQLEVDAASVLLMNPYTQTLEYAAGSGFRSRVIEQTRIRLGEGHVGRAAVERRIIGMCGSSEGGEVCEHVRAMREEAFVSHYVVPLVAKGQVKGVLEVFNRSPLYPKPDWVDFLSALAAQAAIAMDNASLFKDLERSTVELTLAYDATIEGWSKALDMRDKETEGHSRRVTDITVKIARTMGMGEAELVHVRRGALLHDIVKMGIPDSILLKPGALNNEEWDIMRKHPVLSYELLSPIVFLRPALDIPYCHHERWDGTGYPRGLKGDHIPLAARIFAAVDVWDALASDRPYRPAWPKEKILNYLKDGSGRHFDPDVVEAVLSFF